MTIISAFASLPEPWQHWIRDNLARRCEPAGMAAVMVRDGGFEAGLAKAAIAQANGGARSPERVQQSMPKIDTPFNVFSCDGREIEVLLSMDSPRVVLLGNVLSDDECDGLIAYAQPRLERSPVVGDQDGVDQIHAYRTSRGAMFQRGESSLIARVEARLASLTDWPVERGEGLQLLRYEKGNEYRPHFDWFDPALPGPARHLERGGQRLATIIMYLSLPEQGGATTFPNSGLQIRPRRGSALFFANTDRYGVPDKAALHAGEPVASGVKVIATKWLRAREYI